MKKSSFVVCFICIAMVACDSNNKGKQERGALVDTSSRPPKADTIIHARLANDSLQKENAINNVRDRIIGIWAAVGEENATFVIAKDKITYPDQNASYKYALVSDSIHIKFDGYDGNYLVKTRGADTLVLVGDEQQVYYRFKK